MLVRMLVNNYVQVEIISEKNYTNVIWDLTQKLSNVGSPEYRRWGTDRESIPNREPCRPGI